MPIELAFWQLWEISLFGPDRRADPSLSLISVINVFESNLDFFPLLAHFRHFYSNEFAVLTDVPGMVA